MIIHLALLAFAGVSFTACSTTTMKNPEDRAVAPSAPAATLSAVSMSNVASAAFLPNDQIHASAAAPAAGAHRMQALIHSLSHDLRFETGSNQLKPKAVARLHDLAKLLAAEPSAKVAINGFADNSGSEKINQPLSLERARAVESVLLRDGVPAERVSATGNSSRQPVAKNTTASGRAYNRRAEISLD